MNDRIFLALGTNLGDRQGNLTLARKSIESTLGQILKSSMIYETEAWGKPDQPDFYNQVVEIQSTLAPEELLHQILALESSLGRTRIEKWGARVIDIDILFIGDKIVSSPSLQVPHPEIARRKFVLVPLAEIAGEFVHPTVRKSIREILRECSDPLRVLAIK